MAGILPRTPAETEPSAAHHPTGGSELHLAGQVGHTDPTRNKNPCATSSESAL